MSVLTLDSVSLQQGTPSLTVQLGHGRALAVFGPAGSGKSHLLRVVAGLEKPAQGSVRHNGLVTLAEIRGITRRLTPFTLAKRLAGASGSDRMAEALHATRLWEVAKTPIVELSPGQQTACSLLAPLMAHSGLFVLDGSLDALDIWALRSVLDLLADRLRKGAALVMSTNRPELAKRTDTLAVLNDKRVIYAGSYAELERKASQTELTIQSHQQPGVRALVAPFEVSITKVEGGMKIVAAEGQQIAAKLLAEGYGDVKAVVISKPSEEEILRDLIP
jgi:ABC-type multidrug transport system ATPase subunit